MGSLFSFFLLLLLDALAHFSNPYVGILTYLVAPGFLVIGLFWPCWAPSCATARSLKTSGPLPPLRIDLTRPRDRRLFGFFLAGGVLFLLVSALGTYQTYHFTESVNFCGQACHGVMKPEYVTYLHWPARPGLLRGMPYRQGRRMVCPLQAVRRLPGLCHAGQQVSAPHPHADQEPAPGPGNLRAMPLAREVRRQPRPHLQLLPRRRDQHALHRAHAHEGGRRRPHPRPGRRHSLAHERGQQGRIHRHRRGAAEDSLGPHDRLSQGVVTEFRTPKFTNAVDEAALRQMDCMDCHNRPAHRYQTPNTRGEPRHVPGQD